MRSYDSLVQALSNLIFNDRVRKAKTDEKLILDVNVMLRFCDCFNVSFVNRLLVIVTFYKSRTPMRCRTQNLTSDSIKMNFCFRPEVLINANVVVAFRHQIWITDVVARLFQLACVPTFNKMSRDISSRLTNDYRSDV